MSRVWPGAAVVGALAGVLLEVATFLLARYGPSGGDGASWSFRGNGALVVPFGLGPAVVAGAWTALVLHDRAFRGWLSGGVVAGAIGAGLAVADAVSVMLPGAAGVLGIQVLSLLLLVWTIVAPVLARFWRLRAGSVGVGSTEIVEHLATAVLPPGS